MYIIEQIIDLKRKSLDKSERGYLFESLIREIQPWDKKPPIVMSAKSEQLDGVFEYQGMLFIIESKAVDKDITPGSKEWEDYELKLRSRNGHGVIGLFCCLNNVSQPLIDKANLLNEIGITNILIYGSNWEQIYNENFEFCHFLEFMILNARIRKIASVKNLSKARKWYFDKENIKNHFNTICGKQSSIFIRRFKHEKHEQIFVPRKISKSINSQIENFKPSVLKRSKNDSLPQLMILRDLSGSGKTTTAIDYITNNDIAFCFGYSANQIELDVFFDEFLSKIEYSDFGIRELTAVDKPIIFIIESLDEVKRNELHAKRKEIYALIRRVEEINEIAKQQKLLKFPVILLFTVRDDYWGDWDEAFDGREIFELKNRQTIFTEPELAEAIEKYSRAYHFKIENILNINSRIILTTPINLEIFSLANSYNGSITVDDIWEGEILSSFFKRKYENIISKHYLDHFSESTFLTILRKTSNHIILSRELSFKKDDVIELIISYYDHLKLYAEDIVKLFISEHILIYNPKNLDKLRFKYTRFVEYLIALNIIEDIRSGKELTLIDSYIQDIYESHIMDTHTVLKNIRTICCQAEYQVIGQKILDYYQTSEVYLNSFLPKLRFEISLGIKTQLNEIKQLISQTYSQNPQINWDIFFIVCAKNNNQTDGHIISAFISAWEANSELKNTYKRWRLIDKLASKDKLLINETILNTLFKDSTYKDWEVYLGKILEFPPSVKNEFFDLWGQIDGNQLLSKLISRNPSDWIYVSRLIEIILENKNYIIGDYLDDSIIDADYIVFDKKHQYKVGQDKKNSINDYINDLILLTNPKITTNPIGITYFNIPNIASEDEKNYLNEEFVEKIEKKLVQKNETLFKFLIKNFNLYDKLLLAIIKNNFLDISIELPTEKDQETLLTLLANAGVSEYNIFDILNFIYSHGYKKNNVDTYYFSNDSQKISGTYYIIKAYYVIDNISIAKSIRGKEKILYTLYSIKNNFVVGFGYSHLISVANNALQHYKGFSEIIINAMQLYGLVDELLTRKSFKKLYKNHIVIDQDDSMTEALKKVFPELF